jgi:hypothetical protein
VLGKTVEGTLIYGFRQQLAIGSCGTLVEWIEFECLPLDDISNFLRYHFDMGNLVEERLFCNSPFEVISNADK